MKNKTTQGNKKILEREKEIFANENFQKDLALILAIKDKFEKNQEFRRIAAKYSIDGSIGSPFYKLAGLPIKDFTRDDNSIDVCRIFDERSDSYDLVSFAVFSDDPTSYPEKLKNEKFEFPIHVAISPSASKRDVLDFINKKWIDILARLSEFQDENITSFRKKRNAERDQFIWDNRDLPASKLADLVSEKFHDSDLIYSDISSILYYLRKRKASKKV